MAKYRKRPIVVEAYQWFPGTYIDGVEEMPFDATAPNVGEPLYGGYMGRIKTLEDMNDSYHYVTPGDYIIIGIKGEKYACKPDIFEATYEAVPRLIQD